MMSLASSRRWATRFTAARLGPHEAMDYESANSADGGAASKSGMARRPRHRPTGRGLELKGRITWGSVHVGPGPR